MELVSWMQEGEELVNLQKFQKEKLLSSIRNRQGAAIAY